MSDASRYNIGKPGAALTNLPFFDNPLIICLKFLIIPDILVDEAGIDNIEDDGAGNCNKDNDHPSEDQGITCVCENYYY